MPGSEISENKLEGLRENVITEQSENSNKDISNDKKSTDLNKFNNTTKNNSSSKVYSNKKEVFLTFDDGPTNNTTRQVLNILKHNNVKATFFVVGSMVEKNPKLLKELSDSNMCIAPHTYSHIYRDIFSSSKSYMDDLDKCREVIRSATKKDVVPYVRIPGGLENRYVDKTTMREISVLIKERNISYVGWNICPNDAVGNGVSTDEIKNSVVNQSKKLKNNRALVILLHDSYHKKSTVEALPFIIEYYKKQGYVFRTFNDISEKTYDELKNKNVINKDINKAKIK